MKFHLHIGVACGAACLVLASVATGAVRPRAPLDEAAVTALVADLNGSNDARQSVAAGKLGSAPAIPSMRKAAVEALERRLKDGNTQTRTMCAQALGTWGDADCLPALHKALDDREWGVRIGVIDALRKLHQPGSIGPLATHMSAGPEEANMRMALESFGPAAEDAVIKQLDNKDAAIAALACQILRTIGTGKSKPALEKLAASSDRHVSMSAKVALQGLQRRQGR